MTIQINTQLQAVFSFTVRDPETLEVKRESGESPNVVLDNGLKRLGWGGVASYCRVGTGSSTPVPTQTQLDAQIASTSTQQVSASSGVDAAKGYTYKRKTFRFGTGVATGNLTEVGVGWGPDGDTLFNRALIRDTSNNITTVTVLEDEVLDVTVELRAYMSLNSKNTLGTISDIQYELTVTPYIYNHDNCFDTEYHCLSATAYSGNIVNTTSSPSGQIDNFSTHNKTYQGDLTREFEIYWGLNSGNSAPTRTIIVHSPYSAMQFQFNPTLPKDPEKVLRLGFKFTWGRYE